MLPKYFVPVLCCVALFVFFTPLFAQKDDNEGNKDQSPPKITVQLLDAPGDDLALIAIPNDKFKFDRVQIDPLSESATRLIMKVATNANKVQLALPLEALGTNRFSITLTNGGASVASGQFAIVRTAGKVPKGLDGTKVSELYVNGPMPPQLSSVPLPARQQAAFESDPVATMKNANYVEEIAKPQPILVNENELSSSRSLTPALINSTPTSVVPQANPSPTPNGKSAFNKKLQEEVDEPVNRSFRANVGFQQVGAVSADSTTEPYVDVMINFPLGFGRIGCRDKLANGARCPDGHWVNKGPVYKNVFWTNFRLTTSPEQALPNFQTLSSPTLTSFLGTGASSGKVNDLVKSFQVRIGYEAQLTPYKDKGLFSQMQAGLIFGVGASSALSGRTNAVAYKIPRKDGEVVQDFKNIFGPERDYTDLENVILTSGDRERFRRSWFVGGRVRHDLWNDNNGYPAEFDLTLGQDEQLTNILVGQVLKFDAIVPIPLKMSGQKFLYFGANVATRLGRDRKQFVPLFLEPNPKADPFATNNLVYNIRETPFQTDNRDFYGFSLSVDLVRLFKHWNGDLEGGETKGNSKSANSSQTPLIDLVPAKPN